MNSTGFMCGGVEFRVYIVTFRYSEEGHIWSEVFLHRSAAEQRVGELAGITTYLSLDIAPLR